MLTGTPSPGSAAALCGPTQSLGSICFFIQMTIWQIRFFLSPSKYSFCPCSTDLTSLFGVRITTQLVIFGTAILFFHYFTDTIFLSQFPSSVSPKTPLIIATWNAEVRPGPASHFLLPAATCRGRGASPLHLLFICFKHIFSLFNPECQD